MGLSLGTRPETFINFMEFTMSKLTTQTINDVATKYQAFLKAGTSYGEALRKAAQALGGTPCPTLLEALAKVHAAKYQCNYTWNASGGAVFYDGAESTRETRRDDARKSWVRNVMVWFTPEREAKPKHSNRISAEHRKAAQAYLAMFEDAKSALAVLRAVAK